MAGLDSWRPGREDTSMVTDSEWVLARPAAPTAQHGGYTKGRHTYRNNKIIIISRQNHNRDTRRYGI